jgi:integrase/recombinase XerD
MLYVWTRHAKDSEGNDCKYVDDMYARRCRCPKWISGTLNGKRYRKSAKTRSWEGAEERRKKLDESPEEAGRVTVAQAVKEYLQTSKDTGNADGTFIRKRFIFGELSARLYDRSPRVKGADTRAQTWSRS